MRSPQTVLDEIREETSELLDCGKEHTDVRRKLAETKAQWERLNALALMEIQVEAAGARMPAEDIRNAIALTKIERDHPGLRGRLLALTAEADALDRIIKVRTSRVNALQSELAWLRMEYEQGK